MLRNVTAIERDGLHVRVLVLTFDVPDKDFPLQQAVRDAVTDFCKTEEGRKIYGGNCDCFNWADVEVYLPNSFCEARGFRRVDSVLGDIEVDWDEHLVDDDALGICEE